ncbi:MAG: TolC family protein [Proteobacteria bacterium]|nr:TolC family protein [Pseudomonadota bacterium]
MIRLLLISLSALCLCTATTGFTHAAQQQNKQAETVLNLSDCVKIAFANSPQLETSKADVVEKEALLSSTRKDLYPTLSFEYGYTHSPDAYAPFGVEDYYRYSFIVEQPVYEGKALITAVELSELDLDYSKSSMVLTKNDIVLAVHETYYNLLKTRKFEDVARQSVKEREAHLRDAKAFYDAGLIPKNDMLQSEVELARAEVNLVRTINLSTMAMANLNILLRKPVETHLNIEDILTYETSEISWEETIQDAEKYRPEMMQADINIEQAEKNITLTKAPFLPSVYVSADYMRQGDTPLADDYPLGPSDVKKAQAKLEWQFWNWRQSKDEVAAAKHALRKSNESKLKTFDTITLQVREAYLDIKETAINIQLTKKAIEHAEEDFRINESRYKAQLSTSTDVLDAQTRLTTAKINYYNALYNYQIAIMRLAWATGTLQQTQK